MATIESKVEVFMEKGVCGRAETAGGELASRRNKKARDFMHPFFHKSTLLSTWSIEMGNVTSIK